MEEERLKTDIRAHSRKGTKGVKAHKRTLTNKKVPHEENYLQKKYREERERDKDYLTSRNKAIDKMNALVSKLEREKRENPSEFSSKFPMTQNRQKELERSKLLRTYYLNSVGSESKAVIIDRNSGAYTHKRYTTELVLMSPQDFLNLSTSAVRYNQDSINFNKQKMKNGVPLEPLVLDIDVPNNIVAHHEGRHRSEAAKELGIKRIPVILAHTDSGSSISADESINIKTVKRQQRYR